MTPKVVSHRIPSILFGLAGLVVAATWLATRWLVPSTDDLLIAHYTVYFGVDLVDQWQTIFYPAVLGTIIVGLHFVGYMVWRHKSQFAAVLISATALGLSLATAVASGFYIFLNRQ